MHGFRLFLAILLVPVSLFALVPRSKAQTLPDCPFPTAVAASATYTLTENCKMTGATTIRNSGTVLTIHGGGYSVDASALTKSKSILISSNNTNMIINNISFIGGGHTHGGRCIWPATRPLAIRLFAIPTEPRYLTALAQAAIIH